MYVPWVASARQCFSAALPMMGAQFKQNLDLNVKRLQATVRRCTACGIVMTVEY